MAPWIERLARAGFVAKALLYMTVGVMAAMAGLGLGGKAATDQHGAMLSLLHKPLGRGLLAAIAIGLTGYAVWRIIEAFADPEGHGRSAKGLAHRVRSFITGGIHLGLALSAAKLALYQHDDHNSSREAQEWTARALSKPGGKLIVGLAAAAFVGYGLYQLFKAIKSKLNKRLALESLGHTTRKIVVGVSRFGIAARGIVFGMIGVMLARAAYDGNAKEAGGVSKSMRELFGFGTQPFVAIAVGLMAYGVYQLINARYRRIRVD
ncbi:MAG: DUF1206 domain-containing protein [Deltaproteobacteria bacterium]|nr:DUF1206 domain-containing protein [Deltaproteobacteria bacterium]